MPKIHFADPNLWADADETDLRSWDRTFHNYPACVANSNEGYTRNYLTTEDTDAVTCERCKRTALFRLMAGTHTARHCDWCEQPRQIVAFNWFKEALCANCAAKCCETCSRGLDNNLDEHDGCSMRPLKHYSIA